MFVHDPLGKSLNREEGVRYMIDLTSSALAALQQSNHRLFPTRRSRDTGPFACVFFVTKVYPPLCMFGIDIFLAHLGFYDAGVLSSVV